MNENSAYLFEVEEPHQWIFDGRPTWISGWFLSKTGAVFSDIRAVIDGVPYLGVLGMPRESIEQRHRGHCQLPRAASERTSHSPGRESITDSVLPPIDPVEPSMQIRLGIEIHCGLRISD